MHWKNLLSYVRYLPEVTGVAVQLLPGQQYAIRLARLRRKGKTVSYAGGEYEVTAFSKILPRDQPLAVFLEGTGIMHRIVDATGGKPGAPFMAHADPNDLYVQRVDLAGEHTLYSYIKRADADHVLALFRKAGLEVLSLSLGPFAILPLLPALADPNDERMLQIDRHCFSLVAGRCTGYSTTVEVPPAYTPIRIAGEEIDERLFPAFAQGFCLISDLPVPALDVPDIQEQEREHREKWQFKRTGWALLVFFLAVLLVNAGLFFSVSRKLEAQTPANLLQQQAAVDRLKEHLESREQLWQAVYPAGDRTPPPMAWMADRLAGALPDALLLQTLTFYPKTHAAIGNGQPPGYAFDRIAIKGESREMQALQDWLKAVGEMTFCKRVRLESYQVQKDGTGVFNMLIQLR